MPESWSDIGRGITGVSTNYRYDNILYLLHYTIIVCYSIIYHCIVYCSMLYDCIIVLVVTRKGTNGVSTNGVTANMISSGKGTHGVTASMDKTDISSERDKWGQH